MDHLILIDAMPTYVRLEAIDGISVDPETNETLIHLRGGGVMRTETEADEVMESLKKAQDDADLTL